MQLSPIPEIGSTEVEPGATAPHLSAGSPSATDAFPLPADTQFRVSIISSTRPAVLTKTFTLKDGQLEKSVSAHMSVGTVEVTALRSLQDFVELLQRLNTAQALCYGIPRDPAARHIVTKKNASRHPGAISRSNEDFCWPDGGGILMLDYDPDVKVLDRETLIERLRAAVPALQDCAMIWFPSSSSHICRTDGMDLTGLRGQRIYVAAEKAAEIPEIGAAIEALLWSAGIGNIKVSSSGNMLPRTLVDTAVWQPSRLDFAAGAATGPGLKQMRGEPMIIPGTAAVLDTKALLAAADVGVRARASASQKRQKDEAQPLADQRRAEWFKVRLERMTDVPDARETLEDALNSAELRPDFQIKVLVDGKQVVLPVGDVLADRHRYDGCLTLDPIEPEYCNSRPVGKLFLGRTSARLHSMARGGATYRLLSRREMIEVSPGLSHEVTQKSLAAMRGSGQFYDYGSTLVESGSDGIFVLDEHVLAYRLAQHVSYYKLIPGKKEDIIIPLDAPLKSMQTILSLGRERGLPSLSGVLHAPILRLDGSILESPGYDAITGLLLNIDRDAFPKIHDTPTMDVARKALGVLWEPFKYFPFADAHSRTATLCAILTALLRPALPTTPMVVTDSGAVGSGKTLLARSIAALLLGTNPSLMAASDLNDDAEIRKKLTACALGAEPVIAFDNAVGTQKSGALAAYLTSPMWSDRPLGKSKVRTSLPARALVLMTGRNLSFSDDLARRVLHCRLDPQVEVAYTRKFAFDPVAKVIEERPRLITAGLTLIRASLTLDTKREAGSLASYEEWDHLIGRTVAWIAKEMAPTAFVDPMDIFVRSGAETSDREDLHELLVELEAKFGNDGFKSRDVALRVADDAELRDMVNDSGQRGMVPSAKSIGQLLLKNRDQPIAGRVLRTRKAGNIRQWQVVRIEEQGS